MVDERVVVRPQSWRYSGGRLGCREAVVLEILSRKIWLKRGLSFGNTMEVRTG